MSFGFGVSDFLTVLQLAKDVYQACQKGPAEYREIAGEVQALQFVLQTLHDDCNNPQSLLNHKGTARKAELLDTVGKCESILKDLNSLLAKHNRLGEDEPSGVRSLWDAYHIGSTDFDVTRGKLTLWTAVISLFLHSLEGSVLARVETKLDLQGSVMARIEANVDIVVARLMRDDLRQPGASSISVASTASVISQLQSDDELAWRLIKEELLVQSISLAQLTLYKNQIITYLKDLLEKSTMDDEEDEGPDNESEAWTYEGVDNTGPRNGEHYTSRPEGDTEASIGAYSVVNSSSSLPVSLRSPGRGKIYLRASVDTEIWGRIGNAKACLLGIRLTVSEGWPPKLVSGCYSLTFRALMIGHASLARSTSSTEQGFEIVEQLPHKVKGPTMDVSWFIESKYGWNADGAITAKWFITSDPRVHYPLPSQIRVGVLLRLDDVERLQVDNEVQSQRKTWVGAWRSPQRDIEQLKVTLQSKVGHRILAVKDLRSYIADGTI